MANSDPPPVVLRYRGSMRAGAFTAQLLVELAATPTTLTLSAMGKSFQINRPQFQGLEETSILGIFKRGIRFRHHQADLPEPLIFYPSINRAVFCQQLKELGWS